MRVRAIRTHFDGVYRTAGEEFEITGKLNRHVEKIKAERPQEVEPVEAAADDAVASIATTVVR
jgi:hypothetical protein